ncbi:hypothetical protein Y600_5995 [Burkholderia pseudomallei MSHR3709]|nr:hypothetical protein Y600_5995 [Burkholderia pseudomallei MSHR3709]
MLRVFLQGLKPLHSFGEIAALGSKLGEFGLSWRKPQFTRIGPQCSHPRAGLLNGPLDRLGGRQVAGALHHNLENVSFC